MGFTYSLPAATKANVPIGSYRNGYRQSALSSTPQCLVFGRVAAVVVGSLVAVSIAYGAGSPLQFEKRSLSLGECDQGVTAKGTVLFRNMGSHSIRLTGITGACSCSVVDFSDGDIGAGAEGKFTVSISTAQRVGKCDAELTVNYESADGHHSEKITVTVFVRAEGKLVAQPETLYLGYVAAGTIVRTSTEIHHLQYAQRPTHIRSVVAPSWLTAELRQIPGSEPAWGLSVFGTVPHESGLVYDSIVVATDNERFPKLEIPIVLTIDGEFIREPRSIVQVLHVRETVDTPCQVTIRHGNGLPWRVDGVETEGLSTQEIKIEKCDTGESVEKTVVVTAITPPEPSFSVKKGTLLVKAIVQGKSETIRIPILFIWRD